MAEYFVILNGVQQGPLSREALAQLHISPETLVWRSGLQEWVAASQLAEIADIIVNNNASQSGANNQYGQQAQYGPNNQYGANTQYGQQAQYGPNNQYGQNGNGGSVGGEEIIIENEDWYAMINDTRVGPMSVSALIGMGLRPDTPVWRAGMTDWTEASTQSEIMDVLSRQNASGSPFANNPQYGQNTQYGQNPQYGQNTQYGQNPQYGQNQYGQNQYGQNPQYGQNQYGQNSQNRGQSPQMMPTNWMPWAIAATVVGFCTSFIGAIFGVIGILNAHKANTYYSMNNYEDGNKANSTAKTMTIIAIILAVVGFFGSYYFLKSGIF